MKSHIKLLIYLCWFMFCSYANAQSRKEISFIQRQLISKLSGNEPMGSDDALKGRSTASDRRKAADLLATALKDISLNPEKHNYKHPNVNMLVDLLFAPYQGTNVYAVIPATSSSDEFVIIGAHFDAEPGSPGADDNATGVAMVYALAYQISLIEERSRNFMVVFFDQEESDEVGSKAFARKLKKEGVNVHSVHIADMVGWDSDGDLAIEISPASSAMVPAYEKAATELGVPIHKTNVMSSDHKSFHDAGYPAVLLTEEFANGDFNPNYHSADDTFQKLNFNYLSICTALMYIVVSSLATEN